MKKINWFLLVVGLMSCIAAKGLLWGTWLLGFEKHPINIIVLAGVGVASIGYLTYRHYKDRTLIRHKNVN